VNPDELLATTPEHDAAPADVEALEGPVVTDAPPVHDAAPSAVVDNRVYNPEPVHSVTASVAVAPSPASHDMPSLYDTKSTTVVAVFLCVGIIVAVQFIIERIFKEARDIHYALTRFVVSMVALLVAAYLCDLVVSGPDTSLLADSEKATILDFVKSTALMIFSYFFGVKSAGSSAPPTSSPPSE
jgi:hypothetical protein